MTDNLTGFRELNEQLVALGEAATGRELRNALFQASLPAVNAIKAAAPIGTVAHKTYLGRTVGWGFLRRNIRRKNMLRTGNAHAVVLVGPGAEAFYAQFLERGTGKMSARPFIESAFAGAQQSVIDRFAERLTKQIAKAARRK